MSLKPLVSLASKRLDSVVNATTRPSPLIVGSTHEWLACAPSGRCVTRVVTCASAAADERAASSSEAGVIAGRMAPPLAFRSPLPCSSARLAGKGARCPVSRLSLPARRDCAAQRRALQEQQREAGVHEFV